MKALETRNLIVEVYTSKESHSQSDRANTMRFFIKKNSEYLHQTGESEAWSVLYEFRVSHTTERSYMGYSKQIKKVVERKELDDYLQVLTFKEHIWFFQVFVVLR